MNSYPPRYLETYKKGTLKQKIDYLYKNLESCVICPRKCKVNRLKGEIGFCKTSKLPKVCSYFLHKGEEPPISGNRGSGTIFFSHCNMSCCYCQNYKFSQLGEGEEVSLERLAGMMLELQAQGAHNINLVTPTHVMPQILNALSIAIAKGLVLPLVYNTGGYELPEMIDCLDGVIDIYLADMRYGDNINSLKYSKAKDYPAFNQLSIKSMYRQVKNVIFDNEGIMLKGLIVRHLVLPGGVSGTDNILKFIAKNLSCDVHVSLMSQYHPFYRSDEFPEISKRLDVLEYRKAVALKDSLGLTNGWVQEDGGLERLAGVYIKKNT